MAREQRLERRRLHELERLERLRRLAVEEGALATPELDRYIADARAELEREA